MSLTLLAITDGRQDCLRRTLESFELSVDPLLVDRRVVVNDCVEDPAFGDWLDTLGFDEHLRPLPIRRGFAGAIAAGWEATGDADYVFHLEDDFVFQRHIDLKLMTGVLADRPHLAQMALRRQAWNEDEVRAGGVIESRPAEFVDRREGGAHWLEHRCFFTTNPSLLPACTVARGWPQVQHSEGIFSLSLFENPQATCAYWGRREDPPWVHHIGARSGTGY
jgi:hypothetical protein